MCPQNEGLDLFRGFALYLGIKDYKRATAKFLYILCQMFITASNLNGVSILAPTVQGSTSAVVSSTPREAFNFVQEIYKK